MALIAITGGIGSGKSSVSKLLIEQGYPLIDTDQVRDDVDRVCFSFSHINVYMNLTNLSTPIRSQETLLDQI